MRYQLINPVDNTLRPLEQVLKNRGIDPKDLRRFKYPSVDELLDPLLLDHMEDGAKMLISHISRGDAIMVQVDSDADGMTSSALLINYLNRIFPHFVQTKLTYRVHNGKQHGLIIETIPEDIKLVIAPDASSSDYEIHEELAKKGVDVLVIDHHDAPSYSKFACVINNQLSDRYTNKTLSGVGVTYKFCSYLDQLLGTNYADEFVDLVAVGLIADVMVLTDFETREIILRGMKEFKNPLLKAMVEKDTFHFEGQEITPFNISWYISPFLNAICRSGTTAEKRLIFESMLEFSAYEIVPSTKRGCSGQTELKVVQAVRTCTNVKNRQTRAKDATAELINNIIKEENLSENKVIAVKLPKELNVDKNVLGLLANSILGDYNRPVMILNEVLDDGKVYWRGSCRGYDNANLGSFRELLEESGLVEYASGHASAFGTSVPEENFDKLVQYLNEAYKDFDCTPIYNVDFILEGNDNVTQQFISSIADEGQIWGHGVDNPLIALEGIRIYGNHINIYGLDKGKPVLNIKTGDGSELVKFKSSEEEYESLHSDLGYVVINAVGTCSRSTWGVPQIQLIDYEIVGQQQYYF